MLKMVLLKGRVQGVGCRGYCARYARRYGIHGSATNLHNGSVKLIVKSDSEVILKEYLSALLTNPEDYTFFGSIDDISISDHKGNTDGDYNF